nr:flagellar hook-associated protein FlgL [uncultured Duganella sp.]
MRIATSQFQAMMNRGLQENQSQIAKLNEQIASSNRIQVPSDDPVGNVRVSRLTREEAIVGQYRDNIAAAKIRLSTNESYLTSMVNDITQSHDLLVWAADGSNSPADLKAMVTTMTSLRDSLFYSANQKDQEGRFVFSGTATDTAAISDVPGRDPRYKFEGNQNQQKTVVGNGITQTTNVDVAGLDELLNLMDKTITALSSDTLTIGSAALQDAINGNMDGAEKALELIAGKIAQFGGAQNVMNTLDGNHANVSLSNQGAILDLSKLDYAAAVTELGGYNLSVEASYKAYAKVSSLSLFNAL